MTDQSLSILVIAETIPSRADQGSSIRTGNLVRGLARRHHVTVVGHAAGTDAMTAELPLGGVSVHGVGEMPDISRRAKLRRVVSRRSFQGSRFDTPGMRAAVEEVVMSSRFDLIQIERSQLFALRPDRRTPVVLDEHNIEHALRHQIISRQRSRWKRLLNTVETAKFRAEEEHAWRAVSGCSVTSSVDAAAVSRVAPRTLIAVIPNGVDVDYFRPSGEPPDTDEIVFVGMMDFSPNTDAVTYFALEVMPLVLRQRPSARFTVVGKNVPPGLPERLGPAVRFTGPVADVRPWLARAAVVVVPLRMGSGTRLKVVEGLAAGKAMVSTRVGCEGIGVIDGEHLIVADQPRSFADAVCRLMADPEESSHLGSAGRALVERSYSWEAVVTDLEAFHARVLQDAIG